MALTEKNTLYKRLEVATGLNSRPEPGPKSSIQARGPARPDVLRPEARPGPTHSSPSPARPGPARNTQAHNFVYPNYTRKFLEITMVDCC